MNTGEVVAGIVILVVGVALFWNNYNQLLKCNSTGGQIVTAISKFFTGTGVAACNNASVLEIVGFIAIIVGAIVLFVGANKK